MAGPTDFAAYVDQFADLASLYASGAGQAKGKTKEQFGQEHWNRYGQFEAGRVLEATGQLSPTQQLEQDTKSTVDKSVADATKVTNDALAAAQAMADAIRQQAEQQAQMAQSQAAQQASWIQGLQQQLFSQQQAATAANDAALARAEQEARNKGQKAKAPNVAGLLSRNRSANSRGLGSTFLTGAAGVAPSNLTLGRNALLGA